MLDDGLIVFVLRICFSGWLLEFLADEQSAGVADQYVGLFAMKEVGQVFKLIRRSGAAEAIFDEALAETAFFLEFARTDQSCESAS